MILPLWLSLLALSFGICILGYYTDDEPYLTVGLAIMFLLSIAILTGQLQYESGTTITTISANVTDVTTNYTSWNDTTSHFVGYLMAALTGAGIALSLRNTSRQKKQGADE